MTRESVPVWKVAAIAFFGGMSFLLAWDSLQAQPSDPTPVQLLNSKSPACYRVLARTEIMLSAAGPVLN